jgi:hypothetical protein
MTDVLADFPRDSGEFQIQAGRRADSPQLVCEGKNLGKASQTSSS